MAASKVVIYQDVEGKWRWRAVAVNGRILADSGEGYSRRIDLIRALKRTGQMLSEFEA